MADPPEARVKALVVTTVASTHRAFLLPHADALVRSGWEVLAAAGEPEGTSLTPPYTRFIEVPLTRTLKKPWRLLRSAQSVRRLLLEERPDILHLHTPIAAAVGRLAALTVRPRPAVVYTAHGFHFSPELPETVGRRIYRLAEKLLLRVTDAVITLNSADQQFVEQQVKGSNTLVARSEGIGIDVAALRSAIHRARQQPPPSEIADLVSAGVPFAVAVGRLVHDKHFDDAIQATSIASRLSSLRTLVVLGEGPELHRLRATARRYPALDIRLLGRRQDVPAFLAHAAVFVHPSEREGFPVAPAEALVAGLPVCGYRIRGMRELVTPGTGHLVGLRDVSALGRAMASYVGRPRAQPRDAAIQRLDVRHAVAVTLGIYEQVYPAMLRGHGE